MESIDSIDPNVLGTALNNASMLGILGGTFDPPHLGHLILAETALDALGLSHVLFVPAADPPHKHNHALTPVAQRVGMLELAIADNPRFALSRVDIERPGPHYTVDMLELLNTQFPQATLYFLMGGDSLHDFLTWRDPVGIAARARLAVMRRPDTTIDRAELDAAIPGINERIVFVDAPSIGIAATMLRERLRANHSVRYQLPDSVIRYIAEHHLYAE